MADLTLLYGSLTVTITSATGLKNADLGGKSDPYVRVLLDKNNLCRTHVKNDDLNPVFDEGKLPL